MSGVPFTMYTEPWILIALAPRVFSFFKIVRVNEASLPIECPSRNKSSSSEDLERLNYLGIRHAFRDENANGPLPAPAQRDDHVGQIQ